MQTLTFKTLYVFFITHARRRIVHFNVTAHPTAPWVWRQLLEATPWGQQPRYLIGDRDRSYGGAFIGKARAIGIRRSSLRCGHRRRTPSRSVWSERSGANVSTI